MKDHIAALGLKAALNQNAKIKFGPGYLNKWIGETHVRVEMPSTIRGEHPRLNSDKKKGFPRFVQKNHEEIIDV